jgi:hypothetical protein
MFEATRNPCPRCGTVPRTAAARFCTRCGLALSAGPTKAPPPSIVAPPPPPAYPPRGPGLQARSSPAKPKAKSGCGCLFLILIVVIAIVAVGVYSTRRVKSRPALYSAPIDSASVPTYVPFYAAPKRIGSSLTGFNYAEVRQSGDRNENVRFTATVHVDGTDREVTVAVYPAFVGADQPLQQYGSALTNSAGQITVGRRLTRGGSAGASGSESQTVQMDLPAGMMLGWPGRLEARFVLYDEQGREIDRRTAAFPPLMPYRSN